jgi:GNAT superfamily N-acetyltransferase
MQEETEYTTVQLNQDNFPDFLQIFRASFPGNNTSDNKFRAKFDTSYSGRVYCGFLAYKGPEQPAAYFGFFPMLAEYQGRKLLIGQSGDVATHPSHRQKGLFRLLHNRSLSYCDETGFEFLFAFPNASSLPGFMKSGWSLGEPMETLVRMNQVSLLSRFVRKIFPAQFAAFQAAMLRKHSIQPDTSMQPESLCRKYADGAAMIPRSAEYLGYKLRIESVIIQLSGGSAWVAAKGNQLILCDLFGVNHEELMHELLRFAGKNGFDAILFSSNMPALNGWLTACFGFSARKSIPTTIKATRNGPESLRLCLSGGDFDIL